MRHKLAGIYTVVRVMGDETNLAIRSLGVHRLTSDFRGIVAQATLSARGICRLAGPNQPEPLKTWSLLLPNQPYFFRSPPYAVTSTIVNSLKLRVAQDVSVGRRFRA